MPTHVGDGIVASIDDLINPSPRAVFVVADRAAYRASGACDVLQPWLERRSHVIFDEFEPNPDLDAVERGIDVFRTGEWDAVLAVGGGTALDLGKLIPMFAVQEAPSMQLIDGSAVFTQRAPPLVAVPTTAGTGSEATHFAVVYVGGRKYSVAHEWLLPDLALVDPLLTHALPPAVTAASGLDAFCQAVESLWSVQATEASRELSREALRLAVTNLERAVLEPTPESRRAMSRAANLAGQAINIAKTTAPHAISYTITHRHGVPHGFAVALTLGAILMHNSAVTEDDCTDPRGPRHVRQTIASIVDILGCDSVVTARQRIDELIRTIGGPTTLREVGADTDEERQTIAATVNAARLQNNPRRLDATQLDAILNELRS